MKRTALSRMIPYFTKSMTFKFKCNFIYQMFTLNKFCLKELQQNMQNQFTSAKNLVTLKVFQVRAVWCGYDRLSLFPSSSRVALFSGWDYIVLILYYAHWITDTLHISCLCILLFNFALIFVQYVCVDRCFMLSYSLSESAQQNSPFFEICCRISWTRFRRTIYPISSHYLPRLQHQ